MSSLPGLSLEAFLCWQYDITVVGHEEANISLGMAEILGNIPRRPLLTEEQFKTIINLFEPYREQVEDRLLDFEEDEMSWRSYACYAFDFIPEELDPQVMAILAKLKEESATAVLENK